MKLITYSENHFSNPLQRPKSDHSYPENAYRKPPVILKIVPEADYDTVCLTGENRQRAEKQRFKSTNGREAKLGKNF
jgi:hypothetical protein